MKLKRLFVAVSPLSVIQQSLADLNPHIRGVRWMERNQMHLTLGFFPDVSEEVDLALREKLGVIEFRVFFLPIEGIGAFPPRGRGGHVKIIWIGVGKGHPHLFQLHKRVQDAALAVGLEADLRPWHPHITLARCRDAHGGVLRKFLKSNAELDAGMFRVDAFHLYCSELTPAGPTHTCEMTVAAAVSAA